MVRTTGQSQVVLELTAADQKLAARLEAMRKLLEKLIFEGDFGEPLLNFLTERVLSRGLRYLQANTGKTATEDLSAVRNGIQQVVWMMEFMEKVNVRARPARYAGTLS